MKRKILILSVMITLLVCVSSIVIPNVYAYVHRNRNLNGETKVGHAEIVAINNPTLLNRISFNEKNEVDAVVSVDLDCNIDAVIRVKILPKFYDSVDRNVVISNNLIYVFDNSWGSWLNDDGYMCFYFNKSVKNKDNIRVLNSVRVNDENLAIYQSYKIELIVEVDIIQTNAIDYNNHPWKDNAPSEWIEIIKNI